LSLALNARQSNLPKGNDMINQDDPKKPKISPLEGVPKPFFREAGVGPGVVCLHSNAASSNQWRGLMDLLGLP
jgi:hypothetical protein